MTTLERYIYQAYGLAWSLPFECRELRVAPAGSRPDIIVDYVDELLSSPDARIAVGPLRSISSSSEIYFGLPDIARFVVRDGRTILIEPRSEADDQMIRQMLIGTASALLLLQRGHLPLHASGVVTPGGAVLFMGHSGAGKSTLLCEFLRRGYPMLADDLAAVRLDSDGVAWVEPGVQITKLWADSSAELGQCTEGLARVRPELEKFILPCPGNLANAPVRFATIYAMSSHNQDHIHLEERQDVRKFNALLDHTWQKLVIKRMGLHEAHFRNAVSVANQARIVSVRRPSGGFRLKELADAIESDLMSNSMFA